MPSVSQIISPYKSFAGIPEAVMAAASERGTAVHDACFCLAKGQYPGPLDQVVLGHYNSFQRWFDSQVQDVILVEQRLVHPAYLYHGEPDLIVKLKTGKIALIDIKTPVMPTKVWAAQVAGYRILASAHKIKIDLAGWIQTDREGGVPRVTLAKSGLEDITIFLQMLNIERWTKGA